MSSSRTVDQHHRRSFPWRLVKLIFFFAIAMAALASVAAYADDGVSDGNQALGDDLKPYRQRALTALLINERRSIEQRVEQVMRELERIGSQGSPEAAEPALTRLQQVLMSLGRRLGEVDIELADLSPVLEREQKAGDEADRSAAFIPAQKPRPPETPVAVEPGEYPLERRRKIQEVLVFFGGYDSTIDGDFGARTRAAILRYQGDIGAGPTGRLTEDQVTRLLDAAAARRQQAGMRTLTDDEIGFRLSYPSAFLTLEEASDGGYRLFSDDSGRARLQVVAIDSRDLRTVYDDLTRHAGSGYRHMNGSWFVASGEMDGKMFYAMGRQSGERSIVAHLTYPSAERGHWDPFTVILYNSFELTATS